MSTTASFDQFVKRHIGISEDELNAMLKAIKVKSLDQLIDQTVPSNIRLKKGLKLPEALTEFDYLNELKAVSYTHLTLPTNREV